MIPTGHGPILARKRLANELRRLREERGLTLDHVAGELLISTSKLSRLEKAQGLPQLRDIRDVALFYQLTDDYRDRLMRWARDGRQKGWWTEFSDVFPAGEEQEFVAYENEAEICRAVSTPIVHGLLQVPAYTRALLEGIGPDLSPREIARIVEARAVRQRNIIERGAETPALELRAILYEACLFQSVGPVDAFALQLEALQEFAKLENVDIRVLPFSAPLHVGATLSWQHFSFGQDIDRDVIFIEMPTGHRYIEDESIVKRHERWFDELIRRSLGPEESVARIRDAREALASSGTP